MRDASVRAAAFDWLARQIDRHGDVLPWKLLLRGFELDGERVSLVSMQGDLDEDGEPVVQNGLALCKLHHAAFDRHFLAVRPDYVVEVRPDGKGPHCSSSRECRS